MTNETNQYNQADDLRRQAAALRETAIALERAARLMDQNWNATNGYEIPWGHAA